ncbi:hypothetical protein NMY3_02837 [Candidatus Nitrosocosmicus oleophilus]|uniref:Uncharacterized protein n=1 Tax=Candidatus Nitrosocosmicus oleophilus TaxID=1353260 RepID=A0A654M331_9ARCH|nr:hypothetical protein NMY3_02837 [Candidatus Nitrosocosmicus oleophilus]
MFLVQRNNRYLALVILIQYVRVGKIFSKKALFSGISSLIPSDYGITLLFIPKPFL